MALSHMRRSRPGRPLQTCLVTILFAAASLGMLFLHRLMGGLKPDAPSLQPRVERFTANLPAWAALDPRSWDTNLTYDAAADPLPLLTSFNDTAMEPKRKAKRLPSGAFGQKGEDIVAYENFFYKMRGGTFLELGALDGLSFSNTLLFEHYLGWRGILIEPGPTNYQRLTHNRPRALCLHMAICDSPRQLHFIEQWGEGGIYEYMSPAHRHRWHRKKRPENLPLVSCVPLGFVLERLGVWHINFFSLDVEGGEMHVLRTIDFAKVTFDVVVLEALGDDEEKDASTRSFMEQRGFLFYFRQARNMWFFARGFNASADVRTARSGGKPQINTTGAEPPAWYDEAVA